MSEMQPTDFHAPYVRELTEANDWAGLVRYWLAHQHAPALDAAVGLVDARAQDGTAPWPAQAASLEAVRTDPYDLERELPEGWEHLPDNERLTVGLLLLWPRLALCEFAGQFPPEHQDRLYQMGYDGGEQVVTIGRGLDEPALVAFTRVVQASALYEVRQLEATRDSFAEALTLSQELAWLRPDVYRPLVATTLLGMGNAQRDLGSPEEARHSYAEANRLYQENAVRLPTAHLPDRQGCWHNLGRLLLGEATSLGWPNRPQARDAFREARRCAESYRGHFRDPAQRRRVQSEALGVYENLLRVNVDLWRLESVADALHEAVETAEASR